MSYLLQDLQRQLAYARAAANSRSAEMGVQSSAERVPENRSIAESGTQTEHAAGAGEWAVMGHVGCSDGSWLGVQCGCAVLSVQ